MYVSRTAQTLVFIKNVYEIMNFKAMYLYISEKNAEEEKPIVQPSCCRYNLP